jgi:LysR family hydrogen peroxide-inducible transcriptional activator
MTLTELKYIVAVARARHFGHAAEACFVAQPTLSVAIKKLEDELGVTLFERGGSEVSVTPLGAQIVAQAERVLEQTAAIKELAKQNKDPLAGPLRLGVIYTIGPYLLPPLVKNLIDTCRRCRWSCRRISRSSCSTCCARANSTPPSWRCRCRNTAWRCSRCTTNRSWSPCRNPSPVGHAQGHLRRRPEERNHAAAGRRPLLPRPGAGSLPGDGALFSPSAGNGMQRTFEGSSLETIRHMVASGIGLTVLPRASVPDMKDPNGMLTFVPVPGPGAVAPRGDRLAQELYAAPPSTPCAKRWRSAACNLPGVTPLHAG